MASPAIARIQPIRLPGRRAMRSAPTVENTTTWTIAKTVSTARRTIPSEGEMDKYNGALNTTSTTDRTHNDKASEEAARRLIPPTPPRPGPLTLLPPPPSSAPTALKPYGKRYEDGVVSRGS